MKATLELTPVSIKTSSVQEATQSKTRLTYIDNLRVLMTFLVIMVHAAVTYGGAGGWFTRDPNPEPLASALLTLFNALCQSFFMGLFFFLSGYFVPGSIDRKGFAWFWKDRLLRLGLPLLVFTVVLAKAPLYLDGAYFHRFNLSFWEFSAQHFFKSFDAGPTWFLFALLLFSAVYSLGRFLLPGLNPAFLNQPSSGALLIFALVMAGLMFVTCQASPIGQFNQYLGFVYLQPAFFGQYILMFAAGILAYRGKWLDGLAGEGNGIWKWVALACMLALPVGFALGGGASGSLEVFMTGYHWQFIFLVTWVGFACVSISLTLMGLFARRFNAPSRLQAFFSSNTFAAYVLHPLVLVSVTLAMTDLPWPVLLKFLTAVLLTIGLTYGLASLVRRLPGVKQVL